MPTAILQQTNRKMVGENGSARPGRERILAAARARFVAHGYAAMTMQEIADAVGVTKTALFGEAFIVEMERVYAGIAAALATESALIRQLEAVARFLLNTSGIEFARLVADLDRYVALDRRQNRLDRAPRPRDVVRSAFETAVARGEIRPVDLDVAVSLFFSMVFGQMRNAAYGSPAPATNEVLAPAIASMVMHGIGTVQTDRRTERRCSDD